MVGSLTGKQESDIPEQATEDGRILPRTRLIEGLLAAKAVRVVLLEAHYLDHWPVSRYAERLGLSTERLNRLVRAETGRNAQALLHARLAREASRRLVHIAAPVSRLAFELGFEDPAYFCRFFKRHHGLSPSAYRTRAGAG